MCLGSAPSAPAPDTKPPQYLHNTFLDNAPGASQAGANLGRNSLVIPQTNSSSNTGTGLALPASQPNPGLQTPTTPAPRLPGRVVPSLRGLPVSAPQLGGAFPGAIPATAPLKAQ